MGKVRERSTSDIYCDTNNYAEAEKIPQDEIIRELVAERPAILKWLLDGFADWQHDHHWMADEVKAATEEYRQEQDRLAGFFADCCEFRPHYEVAVADLYSAYVGWCEREGEEPLKKRSFGERLRDRGIAQKKQTGGARFWVGIRLVKNSGVEWQTFRKFSIGDDIEKVTETLPLNATNFYEHEQPLQNNLADKGGQTFRKFSIGDDVEKVTETLSANACLSSDREQPPENDNITAQKPLDEWPTCRGCNRKVPEVDKAGLCDDCVAIYVRQRGGG